MDDAMRFAELSLRGYGCTQILVTLALDAEGKSAPELVRASAALHGGLGQSGKLCGALTGGALALALRLGGEGPAERESPRLAPLVQALVAWFEAEYTPRFGGVDCADLAGTDARLRMERCPAIVLAVQQKVEELLAAEGA